MCFDEFQVTDIADALLLSNLFKILWANGTILIATSNRPPMDLYKDGLNRQYFMPFIEAMQKQCITRHVNSHIDYRFLAKPDQSSFFTPNDETTRLQLWDKFLASYSEVGAHLNDTES